MTARLATAAIFSILSVSLFGFATPASAQQDSQNGTVTNGTSNRPVPASEAGDDTTNPQDTTAQPESTDATQNPTDTTMQDDSTPADDAIDNGTVPAEPTDTTIDNSTMQNDTTDPTMQNDTTPADDAGVIVQAPSDSTAPVDTTSPSTYSSPSTTSSPVPSTATSSRRYTPLD
jgi:hypothetical protein